jgi:hypothetical protein
MIFNAGSNACSTLAISKNALIEYGQDKHPRGFSLAVAGALAVLEMTEGKNCRYRRHRGERYSGVTAVVNIRSAVRCQARYTTYPVPTNTFFEGLNMLVPDAQREVRTVFIGGFWGQLVSSAIWLASAALGMWVTPRAAILMLVAGGFFIFPVTTLLLRLTRGPASLSRDNPFGNLGMQIAFTLPMTMLLLVPVTAFRLNWFYPALMVLVGAHYLPFTFFYGMRIFVPLCALLISGGVVIALYFSGSFSLGGWTGGVILFIFAWIGRASAQDERRGSE